MTQKIAINVAIGTFTLNIDFAKRMVEDCPELAKHFRFDHAYAWRETDIIPFKLPRNHPYLIEAIEKHGAEYVQGDCSIVVIEIPDDVKWHVAECETGVEWIAENHRTWHWLDHLERVQANEAEDKNG